MKYRSEAACHLASRIRPAVRKRVPTLYPRQCRDCSIGDRKPATLSLSRTSSGARVRNSGEPPWSMVTETLAPLQRLIPQLKQRLETSTYLQLLMDGEAAGVGLDTLFKTGPFPQFLNELDPPETPEPLKRPGEPPNCPQHLRFHRASSSPLLGARAQGGSAVQLQITCYSCNDE